MFSRTFDNNLRDVKVVLSILKKAGLSIKMCKCKLLCKIVDYLGNVVYPGQLGVAKKNSEAIL